MVFSSPAASTHVFAPFPSSCGLTRRSVHPVRANQAAMIWGGILLYILIITIQVFLGIMVESIDKSLKDGTKPVVNHRFFPKIRRDDSRC